MTRVTTDGKQFALGRAPFRFRGVSYGTFRCREDGAPFPERFGVKRDFATMQARGFTVVRTYTPPPDDVVDLAADWDLRLVAGIFWLDWRYLVGASRRQEACLLREARDQVRDAAQRLAGCDHVLALSIANEVPADVVRWIGTPRVARALRSLVDVIRGEDPAVLVTYGNYPTTEYLELDALDFLTFNVFLEQQADLRRYLSRLHHLAGDRPLVLGELGLHAGDTAAGERQQAEVIGWSLETALERGAAGTTIFSWTDEWWVANSPVEGWKFGLTRRDRTARPALDVAADYNTRTVRDLDHPWPSMSVVVCAYNAAATLDECLAHTCALEYPNLEVLVVDDGSTDATPEIACRHSRARVITIKHAGLSVARNVGFQSASGKLVAYLDSDAYPSPEWPWYLALGFDAPNVGSVGGPNLPPIHDPLGGQVVARAPGGPVHVLLSDDRAEHIPGCNMAFRKSVLEDVAGFDPVYTAAGDDVDVCWRLLDSGAEIGFHPAATVWHHRRSGLRLYLRQQRNYGRAEALVEARHPDRFTPIGTARWRGRIYNSLTAPFGRPRIYRGLYGAAAYQSVYREYGHGLEIAHQAGLPLAAALMFTAPLGVIRIWLGLPALLALTFVAALFAVDLVRVDPPRPLRRGRVWFRVRVAGHQALQPLARSWGRHRDGVLARRDLPAREPLPQPVRPTRGGAFVLPHDRPRTEIVALIIDELRQAGLRVVRATGWEDHDGSLLGSTLVRANLVTSAFPEGCVQFRCRRRLRWTRLAFLTTCAGIVAWVSPFAGAIVAVAGAAELGRGWWRTGPKVRRSLRARDTL